MIASEPGPVIRHSTVRGIGIARVVAGNGLEGQGTVLDRARDRASDVHRPAGPQHAIATHQAPGGPDADQAAVIGRITNRTPGVFAERGGAEKGGGRGPGAAAGGARVTAQIPRIVRCAVGMVHAIPRRKLTHVELAQQDGAGGAQPGDHRGVLVGDKIAEDRRAASGEQALGPELVLDRIRHTVQRPAIRPTCQVLLRGTGRLQRVLTADGDIAVQGAIDGVNALEIRLGGFNGGNITLTDQLA